jgi:hypothetical protein
MTAVTELWDAIVQIGTGLSRLVLVLGQFALAWSLLIAWLAWWLLAVNWRRLWPVLAQGAWAPVLLLLVISAAVWSQIDPTDGYFLGFTSVPNFWWQLGDVLVLAALTLCCGWLQDQLGWTPAEVSLEPPAEPAHGHDHGHH